ncbi:MAG: polysaccharide deacetylase family protein, partial [Elainellaceae cyanobacterium]
MTAYPRDLIGYGQAPPHPHWLGDARIALQFVINYEEGGENCILHGDAASEAFLSEIIGAQPLLGVRNLNMESIYEYGSRAGFWRLHRLFTQRQLPVTVYAVAMALDRNSEAAAAMVEAGWEVASHGYRWIDYQYVSEAVEREHIRTAIDLHTQATGSRPLGFYQGRLGPNTRRLVVEEGGFLYDADSYADDLPYWTYDCDRPHLVIP